MSTWKRTPKTPQQQIPINVQNAKRIHIVKGMNGVDASIAASMINKKHTRIRVLLTRPYFYYRHMSRAESNSARLGRWCVKFQSGAADAVRTGGHTLLYDSSKKAWAVWTKMAGREYRVVMYNNTCGPNNITQWAMVAGKANQPLNAPTIKVRNLVVLHSLNLLANHHFIEQLTCGGQKEQDRKPGWGNLLFFIVLKLRVQADQWSSAHFVTQPRVSAASLVKH